MCVTSKICFALQEEKIYYGIKVWTVRVQHVISASKKHFLRFLNNMPGTSFLEFAIRISIHELVYLMMEDQSAFGMWFIFQSTPISCSVHKTKYFFYN